MRLWLRDKLAHTRQTQPSKLDIRALDAVFVCQETRVHECSDVHVGNKAVYNGNVTINHIVDPAPGCLDNKAQVGTTSSVEAAAKWVVCGQWVNVTRLKLCVAVVYAVVLSLTAWCAVISLVANTHSDFVFFNQTEYPPGKGITFVKRTEWGARDPYDFYTKLTSPVGKVIISQTATSPCFDKRACAELTSLIQNFQMDSTYLIDVAYHFLIGGDGLVFIGRGWNFLGEHTLRHNRGSICIALIGTFTRVKPSEEQIASLQSLIDLGVNLTKISKDYVLYSQCQLSATKSPEKFVRRILTNWTHFTTEKDLLKCGDV